MEMKEQLEALIAEQKTFVAKANEEITGLGSVQTETKTALEVLKAQLNAIQAYQQKPSQQEAELKSLGQQFVESGAFTEFKGRAWHKGGAALNVNGSIVERKTTITSSTVGNSTPGILFPQRLPGIVKPPMEQVRVRDLIPFGTTSNNAVEYIKENVFTNAASPQTEGSAKAESALTFTIAHAHVQTIAHWLPATRQILDDFPQLQAYIDGRLLDGLAEAEDAELLNGDGTGLHLSGLITEATAYAGTYDAGSDTRLDKINHALAELEAAKYHPDGIVLNPVDLRILQVIKENITAANQGAYVLGGPGVALPPSIWNLPVAVTTAMTVGKFLVGDFRRYSMGFDRMQSRVDISTEHSTFFTENKVAIRAEERIALAVFAGAAFRYGSF